SIKFFIFLCFFFFFFFFILYLFYIFFFFFQAEDGIRDIGVTWSSDVCSSDLVVILKVADVADRQRVGESGRRRRAFRDRKSTRLNSSHANISYAVFCLKKK